MVLISRGLSGFIFVALYSSQRPVAFASGVGLNNRIYLSLGDDSDEGTPLPIPNRVVKLVSADGTAGETPWESRSSPIFICFYVLIYGRSSKGGRPFLRGGAVAAYWMVS